MNISERRRTRRAWRESEQRFEQSVDALFVHDERGRFVDCNSRTCRLLGYSREELLAMSVEDVSSGRLWQRAIVVAH